MLGKVLSKISTNESLFVCGDMNVYLGKEADGYHGVHGGNGFGSRNMEGELLLEFACAMDLVIETQCSTRAKQRRSHMNQVGAKQWLTIF